MPDMMTRDEYSEWFKTVPETECTFCHPDKHPQIILKDDKNWQWIVALAPYWKYHTMLIPKKHYEDVTDIPPDEMSELVQLYAYARDKFLNASLTYDDGVPIYQYNFMWRIRTDKMAEIEGFHKPKHLHLHLVPDREYMFAPIMDKRAKDFDYTIFL